MVLRVTLGIVNLCLNISVKYSNRFIGADFSTGQVNLYIIIMVFC